jgi:hypothetical protein
MSEYKVIIISTFKPMLPEFQIEQTNALRSWKNLRCNKKIVIIGNDKGVAEFCNQENVINHPKVDKNMYGTPLISSIFHEGWEYANDNDICIFVNGDIILTNSICDVLDKFVRKYPNYNNINYLLTCIRYDWYNYELIDFTDKNWENNIKLNMKGQFATPDGIDIFIHRKNTIEIPYSGIAKFAYDSYILSHAINFFDITINFSNSSTIYHQYGSWYQNNQVCARGTKTEETVINAQSVTSNMHAKGIFNKIYITDCKYIW